MKVTPEINRELKAIAKSLPLFYKEGSIKFSGEKLQSEGVDRDYIKKGSSYVIDHQKIKVDHHRELKNLYKKGGWPSVMAYKRDIEKSAAKKNEIVKEAIKKKQNFKPKRKWFGYHSNKGAFWLWFFRAGLCIRSQRKSKFEFTSAQRDGEERYLYFRAFKTVITFV